MAQAGSIEFLKKSMQDLKNVNLMTKAAHAENVLDQIVIILAEMDSEIDKLKGATNG